MDLVYRNINTKQLMIEDILSKFYLSLNLRLVDRIVELTQIIDHSTPNKELQALFPQLINNIFASSFGNGWNLKTIAYDNIGMNRQDYEALTNFLEPQGPMFRLCYKLLADPQLKYDLPLSSLPMDLQMSLERGRCPQFYSDMLVLDSQTMNVTALALNPFDYYIFNFALHLINNNQQQTSWENKNSAYFALACDYLMHFLPSDPNVPVLPHIPHYTGKLAMSAPLQTANRPLSSPSLLLIPDLIGMNNQHTPQTQSRNEVWRSETVLQVFIDIWMSVEPFNAEDVKHFQIEYPTMTSTPERVRTVRVLVKHIHRFSAKHLTLQTTRSSSLPKYARQILCTRAYHYIKYLVLTWPLDASFRLVLELWLSMIQPWRYMDNTMQHDRFTGYNNNQEERSTNNLDASFAQFVAENFPLYACIFQIVLPRFLRMDLTVYKNAAMLFRLGKVFSQPHLVPILRNLEKAVSDCNIGLNHSPDTSYHSAPEDSFSYNGITLHKWVATAKQSLSEMNLSSTFQYEPIWSENRTPFGIELAQKIILSKMQAERIAEQYANKLNNQNQGLWSRVKQWLMISNTNQDSILEEYKKVPVYLNSCLIYFSDIYELNDSSLRLPVDATTVENASEQSSFGNLSNFQQNITNKLRCKKTEITYMGDPDLMPIMSYESTILVRILYQISSKINEMYGNQFMALWNTNNIWGYISREILQEPCTIRMYVKDCTNHQNLVQQDLPPRLSLRRFGSFSFSVWVTLGYILFKLFSYSGVSYIFLLISLWMVLIVSKAILKMLNEMRT